MKAVNTQVLRQMIAVGRSLLWIGLFISIVFTAAACCERFGWLFSLTSHFRVQYLLMQVVAIVLLFPTKRWKALALSAAIATINVFQIAPFVASSLPKGDVAAGGFVLRMLQINVNSKNCQYEKVVNYVRSVQPDILAIEELTQEWLDAISSALPEYKYRKAAPRPDNFGIGLFSRLPVEDATVVDLAGAGTPSISCRIILPAASLAIFNTHLLPPDTPELLKIQEAQVAAFTELRRNAGNNLVLFGDLNTTSWSYLFSDLLNNNNLKDSRIGFGLQPTWPALEPWFLIPLDHYLVSKSIQVRTRQVGPNVGSDHYPVYIEIAIPGLRSTFTPGSAGFQPAPMPARCRRSQG